MQNVVASPQSKQFMARGRIFKLLSGGLVKLVFRGLDDSWEEEFDLVPGDSVEFSRDFYKIEFTAEFNTTVQFYAGFAKMRRSVTDLVQIGSSTLNTDAVTAEKVQKRLVAARPNRRSLTILPLSHMVYIGALGADINAQIPIAAGQPVTLEITSDVYVTMDPTSADDTADVRILEEIN
ncbi:hypothetical protein RJD39_04855 [Vibrio scophthalmi]|uniref:hypothetical protein n=1 Tax=Vibrio scophthalmi TaxID=45658 RepID=UPI003873BDED